MGAPLFVSVAENDRDGVGGALRLADPVAMPEREGKGLRVEDGETDEDG